MEPPYGTKEFMPSLHNRFQAALPTGQTVDPVLLESLLLALVSGPRHLLIRTGAENVTSIVKATTSLLTLAGYDTHKAKCRGVEHPTTLIQRLLLRVPSNHDRDSIPPTGTRRHAKRTSTSSSIPSPLRRRVVMREDSYASAYSSQLSGRPSTEPHVFEGADDAATLASSRRPTTKHVTSDVRAPAGPPRALVVSGLENVGLPAQRALLLAISNRRVDLDEDSYTRERQPVGETGVWSLPDDFLLIYVCHVEPQERPNIHKGLLDRFSFSVYLRPASISHHRSRSRNDSEPYRSSSGKVPAVVNTEPVLSPAELARLRALAAEPSMLGTPPRPLVVIHHSLGLYAADLLAQARHHAQLDGSLLSARAHDDWPALIRALRVLRGDESGALLVRAAILEVRSVARDIASGTGTYISADHHDGVGEADGLLAGGTLREEGGWLHVTPSKRPVSEADSAAEQAALEPTDVWEVSDEEIRAVLPAVMRHRLRVRDEPEDEVLASLVFPAASSAKRAKAPQAPRRTVDAILKDILDNVDVGVVP